MKSQAACSKTRSTGTPTERVTLQLGLGLEVCGYNV